MVATGRPLGASAAGGTLPAVDLLARMPHTQRARVPAATVGGALVLGAALVAAGWSPLLLVATTTGALVAVLARRLGWTMGLALAPLALLALFVTLCQVYPDVDAPFGASNAVVLVLLGFGSAVALLRAAPPLPSRSGLWAGVGALWLPAALCAAIPVARTIDGSLKLSWAMRNDSVWNIMHSRIILNDGGADPDLHPSPALGVQEVIALFIAPGRGGLAADELLQHDLLRAVQAILVALAGAAVLGALGVARALPERQRRTRFLVASAVSLVPFTWFVMGFAFRLGFWNSILAAAVLAAAWLAFTETGRHPTAASTGQVLAGICLLPIWTPLVLFPFAFGAITVLRSWREHLALRGAALALWLAPVVVLVWYGLFVLRPLLAEHDGALAADGAMFPITLTNVGTILVIVLAVGALSTAVTGRWDELLTAVVLVGVTVFGLWYLMAQRDGLPTGTWGYYPAKFGWSASILAVLVVLRAATVAASRAAATSAVERVVRSGAVLVGVVALGGVLLVQVPPSTETVPPPHWELATMFPLVSILDDDGISRHDPLVIELFALSSPLEQKVASRLHPQPGADGFINSWLLQQPAVRGRDDLRAFSYFLDPTSKEGMCELIRSWGDGVTVVTAMDNWGDKLRRTCPGQRFTVEVR